MYGLHPNEQNLYASIYAESDAMTLMNWYMSNDMSEEFIFGELAAILHAVING